MGRKVNFGYIMLNHMISCCESMTWVLPYGCFLTKVFREFGLDLSTETESDKVFVFDTYTESTKDGEWRCMGDEVEVDSNEDEENNDVKGGC